MRKAARLLFWISVLALAFVTLAPIEMRPVTQLSPEAERFGAFLVVTALLMAGYPKHRAIGLGALAVTAAALEAGQNLVPGRHGRLDDFDFKVAGVLAGAGAAWLGEALANWAKPGREKPSP